MCMGIAKRGDANQAPTCKTFQEAKMGCLQHALGQRRSFSVYFPLHLCYLAVIVQLLLAEETPNPGLS